jgi:hypothetical protein
MTENSQSPSTHGPNGRFAKGNRMGRGNPLAGRAAKIRAVLLKKLTPRQAGEIAGVLIDMAKQGDISAIRELFDRTVGKPTQTELLERIEKLETIAAQRQNGNQNA